MQTYETPEGLTRLTVKIPTDTRNIYFYTPAGVAQQLNPDVSQSEAVEPDPGITPGITSDDQETTNV